MALPNDTLSSTPVPGAFLYPDSLTESPLVDYEQGGVALNDPSQGLQVQRWTLTVDGGDFVVTPDCGSPSVVLSVSGTITTASLAFDRNMRPYLAYTLDSVVHLYWYDTEISDFADMTVAGASYPRLTHDDKRDLQSASSDIIFAYLLDGDLCYRQQRDRFQTERVLAESVVGRLRNIGLSDVGRLQFELS